MIPIDKTIIVPAKVTVVPSTHEEYACEPGYQRVVRSSGYTLSSSGSFLVGNSTVLTASGTSISANGESYYPDKDADPVPNNHYCLKKETIDEKAGTDYRRRIGSVFLAAG